MAGKKSRDKGARGEREVAVFLREHGIAAERGVQRSGSPDSPDVKTGLDRFLHIEVKRAEKLNLYSAMDQARDDSGPHQWPVLWYRRNGRDWVVVMEAGDWVELIRRNVL